tara:strand:- start:77 stop:319 length:243 start_codon:yes stop_codon:yes gene_type:complete
MEIQINSEYLHRSLRKTMSYLVLYILAGLLGELFINYFFIGTNLVSAMLTIYPIFLFALLAWCGLILLLMAIGNFSNVDK